MQRNLLMTTKTDKSEGKRRGAGGMQRSLQIKTSTKTGKKKGRERIAGGRKGGRRVQSNGGREREGERRLDWRRRRSSSRRDAEKPVGEENEGERETDQ